jgi:cytidine deaminase
MPTETSLLCVLSDSQESQIDPKLHAMTPTESLIEAAWNSRQNAYAPYSAFAVGAALLTTDGRIFGGCNVENLSYGLTCCAERVAVSAAVAAGAREFVAMVVVADTETPISPCGACRQVMAEFSIPTVILANRNEQLQLTLDELLPRAKAGILNLPE